MRAEVEGALAHAIDQGIPAQWPAGQAGQPDPRMFGLLETALLLLDNMPAPPGAAFLPVIEAKAPEHLEAFKTMILGVAKAMAEAVDGTSEKESEAIDRIRGALDGPAQA